MQRPRLRSTLTLLVFTLALAGCGLPRGTPVAVSSGLRVWLDQPPDGSVLPLAVFTLRAHARDAGGSGVETITFLVSSGGPPVTVGSVTTDPSLPLVLAEFDWNPSAPGEYLIQAQAFDREGYVFSEPARVCVGLAPGPDGSCGEAGEFTATPTATATPATSAASATPPATTAAQPSASATATTKGQPTTAAPTKTAPPSATGRPADTQRPTNTLTPRPSDTPKPTDTQPPADTAPPVIDKVSAAPNPTFYGSSCSKEQAQFTAVATVTDPSGTASVKLFYRYGAGGVAGPWQAAAMTPAGGDQFTATVVNDATAVYGQLGGADGYVEYYVEATDGLGNVGQSGSPVIAIQYCVG